MLKDRGRMFTVMFTVMFTLHVVLWGDWRWYQVCWN